MKNYIKLPKYSITFKNVINISQWHLVNHLASFSFHFYGALQFGLLTKVAAMQWF